MTNYHLTPSQFREEGKKIIDWIADYYEKIESYPVLSQVKPGEIKAGLPENPPQKGEPFEHIIRDLDEKIMPGITHWQSPNFYAYFPSNTSFPSILGDLVSSGLGVQGMIWATSPAATELETRVLDWLAEMMDMPEKFRSTSTGGGVIQDTASTSALTAVIAARERATKFRSNKTGVREMLVAYVSSQTHSSLEKAIKMAGIGSENLRLVEVDEQFSMRPDLLHELIREDKKKGFHPFFVCATIGTTSSNAIDPVRKIGEICKEENCWLHVDAAMSGTAMLCPEFRYLKDGVELADSYSFNPHKWMFVNFDCNVFWVANREELISTFSILPEYLRNKATESGEVFDYRDWHVQLGRRFRSLKLWFVIRHYGVEGLQFHIRKHVEIAQNFTRWVKDSNEFEMVVEPALNLVCFRHKAGDDFNMALMNAVNETGKAFFTHTKLNGQVVLRMSIGQTYTEEEHVKQTWNLIQKTAGRMTQG
ncbi:aspartate aminotransferase family protein [Mariniphaga sediminis]|uniref:Aspartate aminotransferase family protein n=1 Tax=Mariniphaga sediminis TaxID=1628158 RepID=A0A399D1T3_9BACT|nr:pyridoxal-dependent decarboxylase [Mariniphaga sediminis]RIH65844.1 aspartate aminotransferase family protein [Mariniphaga sediminis]